MTLFRILAICVLAPLLFPSNASAEPAPSCTNAVAACAMARTIHDNVAPMLPYTKEDGTLVTRAYVTGARFTTVMTVSYSSAEIAGGLQKTGGDPDFLVEMLDTNSHYQACNAELLRDLIEIGGQVERVFQTTDGHVITSSVVKDCNNAR